MEQDRFQKSPKLYLFGLICMLISMVLIFFSIYIIFFLVRDYNYGVPEFVSAMSAYLHDTYDYTNARSKTLVELAFLVPGIFFALLSYMVSNYIDNQIYTELEPGALENHETQVQDVKRDLKVSFTLGFKILLLMLLVFLGLIIIQRIVLY